MYGQDYFSEVFNKLKISDFDSAYQLTEHLQDKRLKYDLSNLIDLVSGKLTKGNCNFHVKKEDNNLIKIVSYLGMAICNSKDQNSNNTSSYVNFSKALEISNIENVHSAKVYSIFSILKLLKNEIFIGSKQHEFYLDYLAEIKKDKIDELIHVLYSVSLDSKEDLNFDSAEDNVLKINILDKYFAEVDVSSPFKAVYFYERGIQNKLRNSFNAALSDFKSSIEICSEIPLHKELKVKSYWQLSHSFYFMNLTDSAQIYLDKAKFLSKTKRDDFYNSRLQAWIHNKSQKFDSAYDFLNRSIELEYKLGAKNNTLETALLSIENQTEKLKMDKLRLDNRRKTNQNYLIIAISLLVLGSITTVLLQKNTTKKRQLAEQEAVLKQQRVENLLKEQELVSIDAMIAGQEKERQKVAGELHDDLGSLMATIKLHFDNAKISKQDPALNNAQKLLEEAYQKIRGMAHSKNSGVMSDQGLLAAIKKMATVITDSNALKVSVEDFGLGERLENSLELSIFRMVQELVANAIKHAEATKVNIQLTQHEDNLNIIVEDNGKGFDRSKLDKNESGMGLTNIEKRVEHLEGSFTVDSIVGKGTSILIDIPV